MPVDPSTVQVGYPDGKSPEDPTIRTIAICAVRVELAAFVALRNGHLRKLPDACHLRVVKRVHKVRARDRVVRDDARAVPGLRVPRDLDVLRVPNRATPA